MISDATIRELAHALSRLADVLSKLDAGPRPIQSEREDGGGSCNGNPETAARERGSSGLFDVAPV